MKFREFLLHFAVFQLVGDFLSASVLSCFQFCFQRSVFIGKLPVSFIVLFQLCAHGFRRWNIFIQQCSQFFHLRFLVKKIGVCHERHNLFLHSEVIQSHEYNKKDDASIKKVLKYELFDTLFSMIVGWGVNSAMILLAAATFFKSGIQVEELQQAKSLLEPLLGSNAAIVFALALLMAGISSTITSGMAAGSIFAGIFGESYHIKDSHSQVGVLLSLGIALLLIFFIGDPFKGLIISQMILSIQLPFTVFLQVGLTSSRKVMGDYVNSRWSTFVLYSIAIIVSVLNIMLLFS